MNNKDNYKVTITKNGEPITEIETDCVIAAINNQKKDGVAILFASSCSSMTIFNTLRALDNLKKNVLEENPEIKPLMLMAALESITEKLDRKEDEKEPCGMSDFFAELFKQGR